MAVDAQVGGLAALAVSGHGASPESTGAVMVSPA